MLDIFGQIQNSLPEWSAAALFFVFFFGTFVSEDGACILAGTAVASGRVSFVLAASACFLGIFTGDVLLFGIGRLLGPRALENRIVRRFVSESAASRASSWLGNNAAAAVLMSRFIPGLRLPTYLAAGALKTDFTRFAAWFLIASFVWTPILVGSTAFSQRFLFQENAILGFIVIALVLRFSLKFLSWRNRRLFVGRLKRIWQWEFWPIQVFYSPVVLYVLFLGLRHRGMTVFTAVNPALPAGGFKGESKNQIYSGLRNADGVSPFLLDHVLLEFDRSIEERVEGSARFIEEYGLNFPMVLKPDAGERGKDVSIVHSMDELEAVISNSKLDLLFQEFAPGDEISVFYYRHPHEDHGNIYSITEKRFPQLIGDGRSTIEELILNDPRAVCLAEKYFEQNRQRIADIPRNGEKIAIVDIGTHSRGAIFLDGGWLKTYALEQRIDEICRKFDGFYFGRFDIRTSSLDDLKRGYNFKIIELNGVTSESTNIYDPQYSLFGAYRILFRQWRIAFEIGAANRDRGTSPTSLLELTRMAIGFRPRATTSIPSTSDRQVV